MRVIAVLMCVFALVGCQKEPPAYESRYTDAPVASSIGAPIPPQAGFVDHFDRPDTPQGLGDGWDVRGPYTTAFPLPPATDGFIKGGKFTYAGDAVVYAVRQFPAPVKRAGATGLWRRVRDGAAETTMTVAITPNDRIVSDMIHFSANRGTWELTVRRGAGFEPVAKGVFSPPLALDRPYEFELQAAPDSVTVRVPGDEITTPVNVAELIGDRVFWEEYPTATPASVVFDYDTVWAD